MVVWGGQRTNDDHPTAGAVYSPGLDAWTRLSTVDVPKGRAVTTVVWTGTEFVFWGGYELSYASTGTGGILATLITLPPRGDARMNRTDQTRHRETRRAL